MSTLFGGSENFNPPFSSGAFGDHDIDPTLFSHLQGADLRDVGSRVLPTNSTSTVGFENGTNEASTLIDTAGIPPMSIGATQIIFSEAASYPQYTGSSHASFAPCQAVKTTPLSTVAQNESIAVYGDNPVQRAHHEDMAEPVVSSSLDGAFYANAQAELEPYFRPLGH